MKNARSTAVFIAKIIIGDILFALGFNLFLQPNGLNAGGLSGLAMVLVHFFGLWYRWCCDSCGKSAAVHHRR